MCIASAHTLCGFHDKQYYSSSSFSSSPHIRKSQFPLSLSESSPLSFFFGFFLYKAAYYATQIIICDNDNDLCVGAGFGYLGFTLLEGEEGKGLGEDRFTGLLSHDRAAGGGIRSLGMGSLLELEVEVWTEPMQNGVEGDLEG